MNNATPDTITIEQAAKARRQAANKALNNLRGFIHRPNLTGWVNRNAEWQFRCAFRRVLALEDLVGVDACAKQSDRLRELRVEAMAHGLLTASAVIRIEHEEVER